MVVEGLKLYVVFIFLALTVIYHIRVTIRAGIQAGMGLDAGGAGPGSVTILGC